MKKTKDNQKERLKKQKKIRKDIRQIFDNAGFVLVPQEDVAIEIDGQKSDLDNIFIFENIVVIAEDTIIKDTNAHLRKKAEFFQHCKNNKTATVEFLSKNIPAFKNSSASKFSVNDLHFVFLYATLTEINLLHQKRYPLLIFMDQKIMSYFLSLSKTIKKSARFEMFKFFGISLDKIGSQKSSSLDAGYTGLILPETPSGFPKGYLLISFLIDPATLLKQSYVLRKDGWLDDDFVYQRILIRSKISNMRKYLTEEGRVFVNNVIVTLPDNIQLLNINTKNPINRPINTSAIKDPVIIKIPQQAGNVGIIDGQHRVFSYHEGDDIHEKIISKIRGEQHLLATGIIFPKNISAIERMKFEAKLFLEINDKQTRTRAALRQVIGTIINPFSEISIAKMVVNELAKRDPMEGILEQHFFDKGKLKTTSIVSYGVKHVVKLSGSDSFFDVWSNRDKNILLRSKNKKLLDQYVKYCTDEVAVFLKAFKNNIPTNLWTTNQKISRVLTVTTVTGLMHCMRFLIKNKKRGNYDYYNKRFKKLNGEILFIPEEFEYKSSHWKDLGNKIYKICFK